MQGCALETFETGNTSPAADEDAVQLETFAAGWTWPVPGHSALSQGYNASSGGHEGIDIPAPAGTPVVAARAGKVVAINMDSSYGNAVAILHDGGYSTFYCHLSSRAVGVGASVSAGQVVGYVGSTGNSTGNHLHFRLNTGATQSNYWGTRQNPLNYVSYNSQPSNQDPKGSIDQVTAGPGWINIRGWAFDPDSPSAPIYVYVYVGGNADDSSASFFTVLANTSRQDVANAYEVSSNHGINQYLYQAKSGVQNIYFYGVDTQGGSKKLIATKSIDIPATQVVIYQGTYEVVPEINTSKAISLNRGVSADGANAHVISRTSTPLRLKFDRPEGGAFRITDVTSGLCLGVDSGADGSNVVLHSYTGSTYQRWRVFYASNDFHWIVNEGTGLAMDATLVNGAVGLRLLPAILSIAFTTVMVASITTL